MNVSDGKRVTIKKGLTSKLKVGHESPKKHPPSKVEEKLDKLYDVMNHIRWIGLSIGCMFAITFIVPQCTGS